MSFSFAFILVHLFQLDISGRRYCEARQGHEAVETRPLSKEIRIFESPRPSPQALCAEALPRVHLQRPQRVEKVGEISTLANHLISHLYV